jgi:hypothetical protein
MSVAGKWASPLHGALANPDGTHNLFSPSRNTVSATAARRNDRGVKALLSSFPLQAQRALQRLMDERFVLNAKMKAIDERLAATSQPTMEPDDKRALRLAIQDSNYNLKRIAGPALFPTLMACFEDPELQDGMELEVPSEESAATEQQARMWRRSVGSVGHRVGAAAQYRYVGHNSPNHRGERDLHQRLGAQTGEENLSYFETQQLRHGRARRGSASYAGVWKEVFDSVGEIMPAPEPQPMRGTASVGNLGRDASVFSGGDGGGSGGGGGGGGGWDGWAPTGGAPVSRSPSAGPSAGPSALEPNLHDELRRLKADLERLKANEARQ